MAASGRFRRRACSFCGMPFSCHSFTCVSSLTVQARPHPLGLRALVGLVLPSTAARDLRCFRGGRLAAACFWRMVFCERGELSWIFFDVVLDFGHIGVSEFLVFIDVHGDGEVEASVPGESGAVLVPAVDWDQDAWYGGKWCARWFYAVPVWVFWWLGELTVLFVVGPCVADGGAGVEAVGFEDLEDGFAADGGSVVDCVAFHVMCCGVSNVSLMGLSMVHSLP